MTRSKTISKVFDRYNIKGMPTIIFKDEEHVLWNDNPYQSRAKDARFAAQFTHGTRLGWLEIAFTEFTTDKNGNVREKVISTTLKKEHVAELKKLLDMVEEVE